MTALLEEPAVRERVHRLSVDDYHLMAEMGVFSKEVELLRGIVVRIMAKSPLHEFVRQNLSDCLLASVSAGFKVRFEAPLTLRDSEPEPDLSVVRGKPEDWLAGHPATAHLVVEIAI